MYVSTQHTTYSKYKVLHTQSNNSLNNCYTLIFRQQFCSSADKSILCSCRQLLEQQTESHIWKGAIYDIQKLWTVLFFTERHVSYTHCASERHVSCTLCAMFIFISNLFYHTLSLFQIVNTYASTASETLPSYFRIYF